MSTRHSPFSPVIRGTIAHTDTRSSALEILEIEVEATSIIDLRDASAVAAVGIDLADAVAPWQDVAASGRTPPSWTVRDRLIGVGANGLIDPSRKRPGLWHLVLFRWNDADAPVVRVRERRSAATESNRPIHSP